MENNRIRREEWNVNQKQEGKKSNLEKKTSRREQEEIIYIDQVICTD